MTVYTKKYPVARSCFHQYTPCDVVGVNFTSEATNIPQCVVNKTETALVSLKILNKKLI